MKSKAAALGYPIHPMLIPFPFAFLTGADLFDAAGWLSRRPVVVDDGRSSESGGNRDCASEGDPRFE